MSERLWGLKAYKDSFPKQSLQVHVFDLSF